MFVDMKVAPGQNIIKEGTRRNEGEVVSFPLVKAVQYMTQGLLVPIVSELAVRPSQDIALQDKTVGRAGSVCVVPATQALKLVNGGKAVFAPDVKVAKPAPAKAEKQEKKKEKVDHGDSR